MLLGDWLGNKYDPFVIFKSGVSRREHVQQENNLLRHGFGVRIWKEIYGLQALHGCRIYDNPTAVAFLKYHIGSRDNLEEKILLLWDDFSGHWTDEVKDYAASINIFMMKVSPRYTYVCQPAEIAWNQPFKCRLRGRWLGDLRAQIFKHHALERNRSNERQRLQDVLVTIAREQIQEVDSEKIRALQDQEPMSKFEMVHVAPKRVDITSWICESWKNLSSKTIVGGFAGAYLRCDVRSSESHVSTFDIDDFTELLEQLGKLGATGPVIDSDDEYESSSDEEFNI
ncbi:hypothetical protein PHMEG_0009484 [Phytophthora megakarya]|uniref:DDE-1 domain-containing protein n=1 Tax=Phytophthora megakarya TaxID=4795 RepID=A0A225WI61_9STRA|nr:hypothetical protein PHMEG_0009484 [Phytophthora megakarya]